MVKVELDLDWGIYFQAVVWGGGTGEGASVGDSGKDPFIHEFIL